MSAFGLEAGEPGAAATGTIVTAHLADLGQLTAAERAVYDEVAAQGVLPPSYPDGTQRPCEACSRTVVVGPRTMLAVQLGASVVCMGCARAALALRPQARVDHLGSIPTSRRDLPW